MATICSSSQLGCTFGIFRGGPQPALLKYYSNADVVTKPNDWFQVQDLASSQLEITLRDPWMKQPNWARGDAGQAPLGNGPGDQCPHGSPWYQGGACVIAVVRFNGTLHTADMNITVFGANGSQVGSGFWPGAAMGVAIVRLPISATNLTFASVNYREPRGGAYDGEKYAVVDHWATTSFLLQR